jgi:hypothetical protein
VVGNLPKGFTRDLTRQIKAIAAPTLRTDEPTTSVLVIPPEPIFPAANRARTMLVDEESLIYPKGNEQVPPITFCYRPDVAHDLGGSGIGIQ